MTVRRHVAMWIDHHEARIFYVDASSIDERTLRAPARHLHRHPKGGTAEHNHPEDTQHFFSSIMRELEDAESILVLGPSTAKLELVRFALKHAPAVEAQIIGVETVDHPTDGQLVAYAKRYFTLDDRMRGQHVIARDAR